MEKVGESKIIEKYTQVISENENFKIKEMVLFSEIL